MNLTPVSTLRHFRDEYLAHIDEGRRPAGVCAISPAPLRPRAVRRRPQHRRRALRHGRGPLARGPPRDPAGHPSRPAPSQGLGGNPGRNDDPPGLSDDGPLAAWLRKSTRSGWAMGVRTARGGPRGSGLREMRAAGRRRHVRRREASPWDSADQYMPPPSSGIPPPERPSDFATGNSQTTASVLRSSDAMDAAFCSAERTTLVGSITPASTRFS